MSNKLPDPIRRQVAVTSLRWTLPVILGLVAAFIVGSGFFLWALHEIDDAIEHGCRDRNSAQELDRRNLSEVIDGIRLELPDPEAARPALERALDRQASPAEADIDCDGDGWLTDADYTIPKPDNLPIQIPDRTP